MATALDFRPFDADEHYYEAEDAFTRHVDRRMQKRAVQWVEVNGRKRILVGGKPCVPLSAGSTTAVMCTTPPGVSGAADIVVINPDGQETVYRSGFTYKEPLGGSTRLFLPLVQR